MNGELIMDFTALDSLAEEKKLSLAAQKFIYLVWLGLTPSEIVCAYYNINMRTLEWSDRTLFIKEDKIAEYLSAESGRPLDNESISAAQSELENAGISVEQVYKSGFFNMRFEQSKLKQPEDIVRIKEMRRNIGNNAEELEKEYELYCGIRSEK